MKKRNLVILLLIPFLMCILTTVTINATYIYVDVDISDISWKYDDVETVKINTEQRLEADGINLRNYKVGSDNDLVWSVRNKEGSMEPLAKIVQRNGEYYLSTLSEGAVIVTCSTKKGNVSRSFEAIVYDKGAVAATYEIAKGNNVDSVTYIGEYDLKNFQKQKASFRIKVTTAPSSLKEALQVECSDNVTLSEDYTTVTVSEPGEACIAFKVDDESISDYLLKFTVVKDGINVFDYNQLLYCTNASQSGETVVLRKSLQSRAYGESALSANNWAYFGNYDSAKKTYNFKNEIYSLQTKYNNRYIMQYNDGKPESEKISDFVNVGVRVQKDFYGNGYTLNMHALAYPYGEIASVSGEEINVLTPENLFRGPLPFYSLGDISQPIVAAYGQDNIGFYVDGDGITVNDVKLQNCDNVNSYKKLEYTGTVCEVSGDNVTIKNCEISNGKTVFRAFSCNALKVDNCYMRNSQNFLMSLGANEYVAVGDGKKQLVDLYGNRISATLSEYLSKDAAGDRLLEEYLIGSITSENTEKIKEALISLQNALDELSEVEGKFKGDVTVNNCQFERSGIAAIAMESLFNGPFLYSTQAPSKVSGLFEMLGLMSTSSVSGISYPIKLKITGKTAFYDYKQVSNMDISGLINENITDMLKELNKDSFGEVDIDYIFPLKTLIGRQTANQGYQYDGKANIAIAFYGGGANASVVEYEDYEYARDLRPIREVDLLEEYLRRSLNSSGGLNQNVFLKVVTIVTGVKPFKFVYTNANKLGSAPSLENMISYANGD